MDREAYVELCSVYAKNGNVMPSDWLYDWTRPWNFVFAEIIS